MKYLLRIKRKENKTDSVSITLRHTLIEFENLKQLIKYLFENAIYIELYEIFEVNEFERDEDDTDDSSKTSMTSKNVSMSCKSSLARFT